LEEKYGNSGSNSRQCGRNAVRFSRDFRGLLLFLPFSATLPPLAELGRYVVTDFIVNTYVHIILAAVDFGGRKDI
jgi:hypothetical protein